MSAEPRAKELLLSSIPIIDETSDTCEQSSDWPVAIYEVFVESGSQSSDRLEWNVAQHLTGATGIEELIQRGDAEWIVEIRCAETLVLQAALSQSLPGIEDQGISGSVTVSIDPRNIGNATLNLWPGVITTKACSLKTDGSEWGRGRVEIGKGRWLVRGSPWKVDHALNSPLAFQGDPDITDGSVTIRPETSGLETRFVICANPDRIELLQKSESGALLACLATCLAMLPYNDEYKIIRDEKDNPTVPQCQLGDSLIETLWNKNPHLKLWDSPEEWDPMEAATLILELPKMPSHLEDE